MATAWHHSLSSVSKFGGKPTDYLHIHEWFDDSKAYLGNFRHRALRHHTQGIQDCISRFGSVIETEDGPVSVRLIAERHIKEDCGYLPTMEDWFKNIPFEEWMLAARPLAYTADETESGKDAINA